MNYYYHINIMNSSFPKSSLTGSWIWTLRDTERQKAEKVLPCTDVRWPQIWIPQRENARICGGWVGGVQSTTRTDCNPAGYFITFNSGHKKEISGLVDAMLNIRSARMFIRFNAPCSEIGLSTNPNYSDSANGNFLVGNTSSINISICASDLYTGL